MRRSPLLSTVLGFALLGCSAAPGASQGEASSQSASTALVGAGCTTNADCGSLEYCSAPEGQCGGAGSCASRGATLMCVSTVQPVCGCDGRTYRNGCEAAKHGASIAQDGACISQPAPFVLQFADTYDVGDPQSTQVQTLQLATDGTYVATMVDGSAEWGSYFSYDAPGLPLTMTLTDGSSWWTAQITTYTSPMTITRGGATDTATAEDTVGPNESLCDDSGGSWTDDEADPATGLFCLCPSGQSYVPSQGGCVSL